MDGIPRAQLKGAVVRNARAEELKHFRLHAVYKTVPADECNMRTGSGPIRSMRPGINHGDDASPEYRSRFVAKEANNHAAEEMLAAAPPP